MFSGLYGDLPEAKDESEKKQQPESTSAAATTPGTWSGSAMLIPTAKRPSAAAAMPPPSVLLRGGGKPRGGSNVATDARNVKEKDKPSETTAAAISPSNPPATASATASASFWGSNIIEEYDPNRPNDYDAICRRKEQLRLETVAEAERQERLREIKELEELEKIRQRDTISIMEVDFAPQEAQNQGGLGFSGGNTNTHSVAGQSAAVAAARGPKGMTLAQRMLEKMGWKQGEGLGKSGQGIAAPLAVQKTDARSGKVVALEPLMPTTATTIAGFGASSGVVDKEREPLDLKTAGPPSKVIVLRNVVPPGAVDESLDEEIGLECSKYGEVTSVLIFEVTEPNFPEEEAVRVYIQFQQQKEATAALLDLHGRFFGGRAVRGRYFDEIRFENGDLAPKLGLDI